MAERDLTPESVVRLEGDAVVLLDQRRLPEAEIELRCESAAEVAEAIRTLAIRGAPAIGVAAAYGLALAARRGDDLDAAYEVLAAARPTAVNLRWALDELRDDPTPERARALHEAEVERCKGMAERASSCTSGCSAPDALQHRCPRDGRLRFGARSDSGRMGRWARGARVGRRDAAAAPGGATDGVGARGARHPVRASSSTARRPRSWPRGRSTPSSRAPTGSRRTATSRTRSAPTGSRCAAAHHGIPLVVVAPTSTLDPSAATGADVPIEERDAPRSARGSRPTIRPSMSRPQSSSRRS